MSCNCSVHVSTCKFLRMVQQLSSEHNVGSCCLKLLVHVLQQQVYGCVQYCRARVRTVQLPFELVLRWMSCARRLELLGAGCRRGGWRVARRAGDASGVFLRRRSLDSTSASSPSLSVMADVGWSSSTARWPGARSSACARDPGPSEMLSSADDDEARGARLSPAAAAVAAAAAFTVAVAAVSWRDCD